MTDSSDIPGSAADRTARSVREHVGVETWRNEAEATLPEGTTLDTLAHRTREGLRIEALYHQRPDGSDAATEVPVARKRWDNRLRLTGENDAEMNAHVLRGLEGGITSLEIPSTTDGSPGSVSPVSLIDTLAGVRLEKIALSLAPGQDSESRAKALLQAWDQAGHVDPAGFSAELGFDPIGQLLLHGADLVDVEQQLASAGRCAVEVTSRFPAVSTVTCNTVLQHCAGGGVVLELMAAVGAAGHCLQALLDAGVPRENVARQIGFQVAVDARFLISAVKLRALRRLWHHALDQLRLPSSPVHVTAETSPRYQSRREPWMNHLRHICAAMAAAAGGADALIVHPHNRVDGQWLDKATLLGERMARNTVPILEQEAYMLAVTDPLAGSYAAESLTHELCGSVWTGLGELQRDGGLIAAVLSGAWQQRIDREHLREMQLLASGEAALIGVNRFTEEGVTPDQPAPALTTRGTTFERQRVASAFGA